ncbi:hypothetical protein Y032_0062g3345 [Ancylostoma ceylanicum]|uniref:Uncharacterized protein n=1 Tax=Ancylostoma ceylanicum TaxID=53326 RepID=A0A016U3C9_9BILA|nr:hypothetical protein Y032_0062g3345 [Ancylostoma ceylanicum]
MLHFRSGLQNWGNLFEKCYKFNQTPTNLPVMKTRNPMRKRMRCIVGNVVPCLVELVFIHSDTAYWFVNSFRKTPVEPEMNNLKWAFVCSAS